MAPRDDVHSRSNRNDILVRCAAALLQSGNKAGLATVISALEGNDQMMREEALEDIGGEQNYWSG